MFILYLSYVATGDIAASEQGRYVSDKCREGNEESDNIGQLQQQIREMEQTLQSERLQHYEEKAQLQATNAEESSVLTRKVAVLERECAGLYQKLTRREERRSKSRIYACKHRLKEWANHWFHGECRTKL